MTQSEPARPSRRPSSLAALPRQAGSTAPPRVARRSATQVAAFFDFDGTLIDGYSAKAVIADRARRGAMGVGDVLRLVGATLRTAGGQDVLHDFMRAEVLALKGQSLEDLDATGRKLARNVLGGWLFPEAAALISYHRRKGHLIVIASSALPFQVEPLARELGVDHVLCTRLEARDGICTGELAGDVLWGRPKAEALAAYARAEGIDLARSYGYANGIEDVEFLDSLGHPTAVNPGPELTEVARDRSWPTKRFAHRPAAGVLEVARTAAAYGGLAAGACVGAALGLMNHSRRDAANLTFSVGSDVGLALAGVHLNVTGEQNLWSQRPAVFIFNHQSLLDGWVAINLVRSDFTGVGKKEMSRLPLLAQLAWLTNVALVDRADPAKAQASLAPVVERLREGYSITIAPEGTRSITPRVGPFKKGAFHLAMQAGVPIVPIVIRNAGELQWRGSNVIRSGQLDVTVLPPISVAEWTCADLGQRVSEVRQRFVDTLDGWDEATTRLSRQR
jgi:putative phosphoserine phosphatase/1-acylglycerol-3-phosphate O-acyltransferase